jgi:hypothetical protein
MRTLGLALAIVGCLTAAAASAQGADSTAQALISNGLSVTGTAVAHPRRAVPTLKPSRAKMAPKPARYSEFPSAIQTGSFH